MVVVVVLGIDNRGRSSFFIGGTGERKTDTTFDFSKPITTDTIIKISLMRFFSP